MKVMTRGFSSAAIAVAATLGLSLMGAHRSVAAPEPAQSLDNGPRLKLLSPTARATFQGVKPIEIDALYEGTPGNGIVSLDLYIDGVKAQSQALNSPEAKGMVSFLVDSSLMTPGTHYVVVRATAADAEVRTVRGSFIYQDGSENSISVPGGAGDPNALDWPSAPGDAPQMHLVYPAPNATVQGKITIQVDASDADGKPPYVSIFVDGEMKQLVNYRPFEYEWDTTPVSNGWHTIAIVEAFDNDAISAAHLNPIRVYVNNPGGQTEIRTDLLDGPKPVKPMFTRPIAPASVAPQRVKHVQPLVSALPALPMEPRVMPAPRKTLAVRPLARRPIGDAALALPASAPDWTGHRSLIAELDPRWDNPTALIAPALSDPTVVDLPAPPVPAAPPKTTLSIPTGGFKPWAGANKPETMPVPTGAPLTAPFLLGKRQHRIAQSLRPPLLMAEGGPLDERLAAPMLSLPELPVEPAPVAVAVPHPATVTIAEPRPGMVDVPAPVTLAPHRVRVVVTPHPAPKETLRVVNAPAFAPQMPIQVHLPLHAPQAIKLHLALGAASLLRVPQAIKLHVGLSSSLLRAVGENQVQFNQTALALERPLAARQNILFGPLRRIFEYGGGSLEWNARSGVVRALTASKDIRLTIGDRNAVVNNQPFVLNGVPYLSSGRTMVPLAFIGVAMDANVQYDPATGHLKITSRH